MQAVNDWGTNKKPSMHVQHCEYRYIECDTKSRWRFDSGCAVWQVSLALFKSPYLTKHSHSRPVHNAGAKIALRGQFLNR